MNITISSSENQALCVYMTICTSENLAHDMCVAVSPPRELREVGLLLQRSCTVGSLAQKRLLPLQQWCCMQGLTSPAAQHSGIRCWQTRTSSPGAREGMSRPLLSKGG